MTGTGDVGVLRAAALQAIVDTLLESYAVQRCTLRLDVPGQVFPVVHEARAEGVRTLIGDKAVALPGQPVVEALRGGASQVVQHDSTSASEDPAFQAMLVSYGDMGAQIVTAVRIDGQLAGMVSLHALGRGPRTWTPEETAGATAACELIGRVIA